MTEINHYITWGFLWKLRKWNRFRFRWNLPHLDFLLFDMAVPPPCRRYHGRPSSWKERGRIRRAQREIQVGVLIYLPWEKDVYKAIKIGFFAPPPRRPPSRPRAPPGRRRRPPPGRPSLGLRARIRAQGGRGGKEKRGKERERNRERKE